MAVAVKRRCDLFVRHEFRQRLEVDARRDHHGRGSVPGLVKQNGISFALTRGADLAERADDAFPEPFDMTTGRSRTG